MIDGNTYSQPYQSVETLTQTQMWTHSGTNCSDLEAKLTKFFFKTILKRFDDVCYNIGRCHASSTQCYINISYFSEFGTLAGC